MLIKGWYLFEALCLLRKYSIVSGFKSKLEKAILEDIAFGFKYN